MSDSARIRWMVVFDHTSLNATDIRMLTAVVEADLRLMHLARDTADQRSDEALVCAVKEALSARFPQIAFRVICLEEDGP